MRQSFHFQLNRSWDIQSPMLYRYLEKKFTDEFFTDGSLRLSSFSNFANHVDEQRNDSEEGYGLVIMNAPDGSKVELSAANGLNSYIFCTSTLYCEDIANDFKTDSGFRINNILGFVDAISKKIPYFSGGAEGSCIYLPDKVLELEVDQEIMNDVMHKTRSGDSYGAIQKCIQYTKDLYFLKMLKYRSQCEYRLMWNSGSETNSHIDIKCPEAIQFCTNFEDLKVEKNLHTKKFKKNGCYVRF